MRVLSKSDLLRVEITVNAPTSVSESLSADDAPSPIDEHVSIGLEKLEILVDGLGYENFQSEIIDTPYESDRGMLYARGSFSGPPVSDDKDSRSPYAVSEYSYIIVNNPKSEEFVIEVKHESANIARFKIDSKDISLLNGELPHV